MFSGQTSVMKQEESKILKGLGKDSGFKVPDNYFEEFNKRMLDSLPEQEIKPQVVKRPSLWVRIRPVVYAAASLAGIWCMITVFNNVNGTQGTSIGEIASKIHEDNNADELIMNGDVSDYDIMTYQDSVMQDMEQDGAQLQGVTTQP